MTTKPCKPGTLLFRMLAALAQERSGSEWLVHQMGSMLSADVVPLSVAVEQAHLDGLLERRRRFPAPRAPWCYSLTAKGRRAVVDFEYPVDEAMAPPGGEGEAGGTFERRQLGTATTWPGTAAPPAEAAPAPEEPGAAVMAAMGDELHSRIVDRLMRVPVTEGKGSRVARRGVTARFLGSSSLTTTPAPPAVDSPASDAAGTAAPPAPLGDPAAANSCSAGEAPTEAAQVGGKDDPGAPTPKNGGPQDGDAPPPDLPAAFSVDLAPGDDFTACALWSDGRFEVRAGGGRVVYPAEVARVIVAYLRQHGAPWERDR